jgi:Ca2+-dependent lipid-binding protein
MPSLVKIRVEMARDLPVMDRSAQADASTDAFVEVKLNNITQKTSTCKKTLNPVWNTDFKFEVMDDSTLQDSPVEFSVIDQDLYSSELIGSVYVDLNPLIMRTTHVSSRGPLVISGWFPIFDSVGR